MDRGESAAVGTHLQGETYYAFAFPNVGGKSPLLPGGVRVRVSMGWTTVRTAGGAGPEPAPADDRQPFPIGFLVEALGHMLRRRGVWAA